MGCCSSSPLLVQANNAGPPQNLYAATCLANIMTEDSPTNLADLSKVRLRIQRLLAESTMSAIPHAHRWFAYQHLSGGAEIEGQFPLLYSYLLRLGPSPTQDLTIRFDCHRTFPSMPFFGPVDRPGPGQSQLYRIAVAYSHMDSELGYTQGMNFIIALLLLAGLSEDAAFYAFCGIMLRMRLRLFYLHGLPLAISAHATISELLRTRKPALHAHLEDQGVLPVLYSTPWLLSFWVSSPLPPSTILCVLRNRHA
jgi:hypothetical protein